MEIGSASSPVDLLNKLQTFAAANGWTTNRNNVIGSGSELCISKAGMYMNFRALVNEGIPSVLETGVYSYPSGGSAGVASNGPRYAIAMNGSTGYDGGLEWWRQPGTYSYIPSASRIQYETGQILGASWSSYWFFAHGNNIYMILERSAGVFDHCMFGILDKIGTWTGGQYWRCTASASMGASQQATNHHGFFGVRGMSYVSSQNQALVYIGQTLDGIPAGWRVQFPYGDYGQSPAHGKVFDGIGLFRPLIETSPAVHNSLVQLLPVVVYLFRDTANSNTDTEFSPIGQMNNIYALSVRSLQVNSDYSIGVDSFRVFPFQIKTGTRIGEVSTGYPSGGPGSFGFGIKSN